MVAHDHHTPLACARAPLERIDQPPELTIHVRHLAAIRLVRKAAAKRLGRCVRRVRVVVVHPHKHRRRRRAREPRQRTIGRLASRTLERATHELVVVAIEPARQPELPIEHERRHERGRRIPARLQLSCHERLRLAERPTVLMNAVLGRIAPSEHRRVRRQRHRRRRIRVQEPSAAPRQPRKIRRHRLARLNHVRPRRVERHQQNRRPRTFGRALRSTRRLARARPKKGNSAESCGNHQTPLDQHAETLPASIARNGWCQGRFGRRPRAGVAGPLCGRLAERRTRSTANRARRARRARQLTILCSEPWPAAPARGRRPNRPVADLRSPRPPPNRPITDLPQSAAAARTGPSPTFRSPRPAARTGPLPPRCRSPPC